MALTLYDMHTHTECSHDSRQPIDELCAAELAAGMAGVAITDHSDTPYGHENGDFARLAQSIRNSRAAAQKYAGQLEVLCGVELGEELWSGENARIVHELGEYDVILCSIHGQREDGRCVYGGRDFLHWSDEQLQAYLRQYLYDLGEHAAMADYDILAHLDLPLRYITGKAGRALDLWCCAELVDEVLRTVIRRGKTLEVNTSGLAAGWRCMPDMDVLQRYYELGGRRISVGSDAHSSANAAGGLAATVERLQAIGFTHQTIYRRRQPVEIPFCAE